MKGGSAGASILRGVTLAGLPLSPAPGSAHRAVWNAVPALLISNGTAEDLIGARLARLLHLPVRYSPLVGEGKAYGAVPEAVRVGRVLRLPSGGFPFGSLGNLRADVAAGLVQESVGQWQDAVQGARSAGVVVVVGDAYALMVGTLAARRAGIPLIHVQPLLSAQYLEGLGVRGAIQELNALGANLPMPYELRLAARARAVFVRDAATADYYAARGVAARWAGSFAMDVLGAPERDLSQWTQDEHKENRPVLALVPGSRQDHRQSLPPMLLTAARLPELAALVAWPHDWGAVTLPAGWTLQIENELQAYARGEGVRVPLLRGAFGAIAHAADVAIGTAGTANEQLAGLGKPVVAFATAGPQFTAGFARRQGRLLGEALSVVDANPDALAAEVRALMQDGPRRARAALAGLTRIGPAGALGMIAEEVRRAAGMQSMKRGG
ncbi:lipid-A-disaccharide synthase-related protein [Deinococcus sp. QL22]|uniref:lipid-A-disaccharide synthase-related protein n=1 Tax=Deinococcus sp. QL22 TaxID=2939437 RepID=UPI002017DCEE|nr:lipid-A-disaccharide synthase-related protein [Deinococcus sp. QL22]UQN06431.1 lipid-A-disaccharide synthase-related protein [Deinococcus sp. QL22]